MIESEAAIAITDSDIIAIEELDEQSGSSRVPLPLTRGESGTVLIVETIPFVLPKLVRVLQGNQWTIYATTSLHEAESVLSWTSVDVAVMRASRDTAFNDFLCRLRDCSPATLRVLIAHATDTQANTLATYSARPWAVLQAPLAPQRFTQLIQDGVRLQRQRPGDGAYGELADDPSIFTCDIPVFAAA